MLARAEQWAEEYEPYQKLRQERISQMKSAEMDRQGMLMLIGKLVEKRILHDTPNELLHVATTYPLNSGQINETAEQLMAMFAQTAQSAHRGQSPSNPVAALPSHSGDSPHVLPQGISYWDVYQQLNTVLKPDRMDIPQVLPQSLALFETLEEMMQRM